MPRKPKHKPVAEYIESQVAELTTGGIPEHQPTEAPEAAAPEVALAAPAYLHATYSEPLDDVSFDVASFAQPATNVAAQTEDVNAAPETPAPARKSFAAQAVARSNLSGITVEVERQAAPGKAFPRVLIRFDDDKVPDVSEKQLLNEQGFRFDPSLRAWAANKSQGTVYVAKRTVNEIEKMRGVEGPAFYL